MTMKKKKLYIWLLNNFKMKYYIFINIFKYNIVRENFEQAKNRF